MKNYLTGILLSLLIPVTLGGRTSKSNGNGSLPERGCMAL